MPHIQLIFICIGFLFHFFIISSGFFRHGFPVLTRPWMMVMMMMELVIPPPLRSRRRCWPKSLSSSGLAQRTSRWMSRPGHQFWPEASPPPFLFHTGHENSGTTHRALACARFLVSQGRTLGLDHTPRIPWYTVTLCPRGTPLGEGWPALAAGDGGGLAGRCGARQLGPVHLRRHRPRALALRETGGSFGQLTQIEHFQAVFWQPVPKA